MYEPIYPSRCVSPIKPALTIFRVLAAAIGVLTIAQAQVTQPLSPIDPSPINGETYYLINQLSALQVDLNSGSTATGDHVLQNTRSFSNLSQRWAMTKALPRLLNRLLSCCLGRRCFCQAAGLVRVCPSANPPLDNLQLL